MKKLLAAILSALLTLMMVFPSVALAAGNWIDEVSYDADAGFDGGAGTQADPFIITSATSLAQLAVNVNDKAEPLSYSNVYFRLGANLNLAGKEWAPIGLWQLGDTPRPFSGNFDGNGHTISNMTVNEPTQISVGLFGHTSGALIKDLGVENCDVTGQAMVGGLVGFADEDSSIYNCYTTGAVTAAYDDDGFEVLNGEMAGGLVGNYGQGPATIDGCWSSANVDGYANIGGLVGYSSLGRIINSYATGTVGSATVDYAAGGFIGGFDLTVIDRCYATGSVVGKWEVGGFVGSSDSYGTNNTITNCYARGDATLTDDGWRVGSFAGSARNTDFSNCYGSGKVEYTASTARFIGGFIGQQYSGVTFTSCFFDQTMAGREAVGNDDDAGSHEQEGITGLATANMQGYDTLTNAAKMDALISGAGAPTSSGPIWYAHSADYPDFKPEIFTVTFDSQGATTAASPATMNVELGKTAGTLPAEPVRTGSTFGGWWTQAYGGGTQFTATTTVTGNVTVYAKWTKTDTLSLFVGGRGTLRPNIAGGSWVYDNTFIELTQNSDGSASIKGLKEGTTTVMYTGGGLTEVFMVTILAAELPKTGQSFEWVYILVASAAAVILGAALMRRRSRTEN